MSDVTEETIRAGESVENREALREELQASGIGPAALAATGSVALALYYYYVRGEKQRGQFVGLWPSTILGMAVYLKLDRIERLLQESQLE